MKALLFFVFYSTPIEFSFSRNLRTIRKPTVDITTIHATQLLKRVKILEMLPINSYVIRPFHEIDTVQAKSYVVIYFCN